MALEFFAGYEEQMISLALYITAITIYVALVWFFYKKLSNRDMFDLPPAYDRLGPVKWGLKYIIAFPVFSFVWFAVLSIFLFFLSKSQNVEQILLISMTIVAATRATAYIKEEMSNDLAKLIPLGVLAVFIVDPTLFSLDSTISKFEEALVLSELAIRYFVFVIALEFFLRLLHGIYAKVTENKALKLAKEIKKEEKVKK